MKRRVDSDSDETHFTDGTPIPRVGRIARGFKEEITSRTNWLIATPLIAAGLIYAAGQFNEHVLKRDVFPLTYRDLTGDGIPDPAVGFPIAGTDTDIVGWVNGRDMPASYKPGPLGPVPFKIHIADVHILGTIDKRFVGYPYSRPTTADIEDVDKDGKKDLIFRIWEEFGDENTVPEVAKVFYNIGGK